MIVESLPSTRASRVLQPQSLERFARATGFHAHRVGHAAARLADRLGLGKSFAGQIRLAATLHDIGKTGVPDAILEKPGPLTPDEFEVVKTHTKIGYALLSASPDPTLQLAAEIALNHHERWDGQGYPDGLGGKTIPLSGRIVAVCDVFDALTSERPYKEAWPVKRAAAEIQKQAGAQFCPHVVRAFAGLDPAALRDPGDRNRPDRQSPGEAEVDSGFPALHQELCRG